MKTKILSLSILSLLSITSLFAQDRTTVTATNSEISDNLDLRAVASIFGDSENLADFEQRLNDPKVQISNLDLNEDNKVDYLRVIETVEGYTHIIVVQAVLGRDTFQDVATIEVERDRNNRVQVQVVGDVYMYGPNYIYEPVYVATPVIYASFWVGNYRPYYSSWYWGYYPTYYYAWAPFPVFRYLTHIGLCINVHHHYNYVNYRRCEVAYNSYYRGGRRANAYEVRYPNRAFGVRNTGYANRYELDKTRNIRTVGTRNELAMNSPRGNSSMSSTRGNTTTRNDAPRGNSPRSLESNGNATPRNYGQNGNSPRTYSYSPRSLESNGNATPRNYGQNGNSPRSTNSGYESPRPSRGQESSPRVFSNSGNDSRGSNRSYESPRSSNQGAMSAPRGNSQRSEGNARGGGDSRNRRG